jgi:hypothetical protein
MQAASDVSAVVRHLVESKMYLSCMADEWWVT